MLEQYLDPESNTATYDQDQAVYRDKTDIIDPQMIMVDRLWLWNDPYTVIACFRETFSKDRTSPLQNILCSLDSAAGAPIRSPTALALLVGRKCTDSPRRYVSDRIKVLEMYQATLRDILQKVSR
ncbi:hypothetical protein BCR34DRAFT_595988 [Clohesyomyces aquaticus]|uniref:Uncharacterized protein n=1 Tax=Clohesyomyces aquaticus TaxID=1231657 RepID=A0A1Y2A8D3_9PLEO|nr:hypothetical protein BCR34DRAFT_595988 [Clohesyomyces aquaticus]